MPWGCPEAELDDAPTQEHNANNIPTTILPDHLHFSDYRHTTNDITSLFSLSTYLKTSLSPCSRRAHRHQAAPAGCSRLRGRAKHGASIVCLSKGQKKAAQYSMITPNPGKGRERLQVAHRTPTRCRLRASHFNQRHDTSSPPHNSRGRLRLTRRV